MFLLNLLLGHYDRSLLTKAIRVQIQKKNQVQEFKFNERNIIKTLVYENPKTFKVLILILATLTTTVTKTLQARVMT
jgi:hypothetical protein